MSLEESFGLLAYDMAVRESRMSLCCEYHEKKLSATQNDDKMKVKETI